MCEIDWNLVDNSAILIAAMGDAPCFHDAHVLGSNQPSDLSEVTLQIFRMTPEVDAQSFYKLAKHHQVTLRMSGIQESTLPKPYEGDILGELGVRLDGELLRIEFESVMDLGASALRLASDGVATGCSLRTGSERLPRDSAAAESKEGAKRPTPTRREAPSPHEQRERSERY